MLRIFLSVWKFISCILLLVCEFFYAAVLVLLCLPLLSMYDHQKFWMFCCIIHTRKWNSPLWRKTVFYFLDYSHYQVTFMIIKSDTVRSELNEMYVLNLKKSWAPWNPRILYQQIVIYVSRTNLGLKILPAELNFYIFICVLHFFCSHKYCIRIIECDVIFLYITLL